MPAGKALTGVAGGRAGRRDRPDGRPAGHRPAPAAPRGHRQRQDRGLPACRRRHARARPLGDRARARDRADAADRRPLRRALRRHRRDPALRPDRRPALRRVAAPAARRRPASASARARRSSRRFRTSASIVVDEEHDPSYKQDGEPRYDARRVAELRTRSADAVLLGGQRHAAARELARAHAAVDAGAGRLAGPAARSNCSRWPASRTRSTRSPARRSRGSGREGGKAIVLLNRRGWSNFLSCRACGRVWECPDCDVTLVLHRSARRVSCHHCGHAERGAQGLPGLRLGVGGPPRQRDRAPRIRAGRAARSRPGPAARLGRGAPAGTPSSACWSASTGSTPRCWWAPRWWPRATTSRTSPSEWYSMPTPRCASPTSAPRSARSRSWRSSPGGPGVARGEDGSWFRRSKWVPAACATRRATTPAAFLEDELGRREALSYPPYSHLTRVICAVA